MRGLVTFTAGGEEHGLRFTTNRLCDLEEATGKSVLVFAEALAQPGGASFADVRLLMRAGLVEQPTLEGAGDLIDEIGFPQAMEVISRAFESAFGAAEVPAGRSGKVKAGAV